MDEGSSRNEALYARIQKLEQERDELHKEIEQLCMQKAGPSYIAVATQMHFRRTAGLEQEIENLQNKLESCVKENSDLKQELSEAKRITRHLDQLYNQEVTKNAEAIKQLELLNGVVATASAERDHAMMEAVKAKEDEDLMSQKLHDAEKRTSGLEQEVENLKKKLESCAQENSDIKKNLSEAKTITKHLDQLHKLEVTKNTELAKQLELFNGVFATASAERDHAMMEAVKAKENEDLISQKLNDAEKRTAGLEQQVENLKKQLESCTQANSDINKELSKAKTITKHLDQQHKLEVTKNTEVVKQLELLHGIVATASAERDHAMMEALMAKENKELISQKLHDAEERLQVLTLGSIETQEHLMSLQFKLAKQEQEMDIFRKTINKFYKIREHAGRGIQEEKRGWDNDSGNIGWDDKCACLYNDPLEAWSFNGHQEAFTADYIAALQEQLETLRCYIDDHRDKLQMILSNKLMTEGISSLREYHAQQRIQIMDLLDDGKSYLQAAVVSIEEKLGNLSAGSGSAVVTEVTSSTPNVQPDDSCKTVRQALQEKVVSALLLLSQQEERHLLEVRTALRGTLDELQRNLKQAMEEKVDALMELAELKQEYQLLLERTIQERQDSLTGSSEERKLAAGRDGKLKNLLKRKTSLKRWFSAKENISPVVDPQAGQEGSLTSSRSNLSLDDARLQIENATLKDNIQSLKCLTSNVHKLRLSLMQAKKTPVSEGINDGTLRLLDEIIWEAELVKNALGTPFWPGEGDTASSDDVIAEKDHEDSKSDSVFAAGLEMIELLLLATEITKEKIGE